MGPQTSEAAPDGLDLALALARQARGIVAKSLAVGLLALGGSYLVKPTFTAGAVILPPQQQQSLASSALSSLGALAGLAGGAAGIKSPIDQYVALMQSTTVADRLIDRFKFAEVYDEELRSDVRRRLWANLRVAAGRRDGLITIEFDDKDPQRAAAVANASVEEFRRITSELAITEAQQRKLFFEKQLNQTKQNLAAAQRNLADSGISAGALKAEPKAAAEGFARLKAEYTAAQVRLQAMLGNFTPNAPEVQQQQAGVMALKAQLEKLETASASDNSQSGAYVSRYREYKYHETLFELFARQYELARVDESREGGLVQVVDAAQVPDKKSKPKRAIIAISASVVAGVFLSLLALMQERWRRDANGAKTRAKLGQLWPALLGRG